MELHMQRYEVLQQTQLLQSLNDEAPDNHDQTIVYNAITTTVNALTNANAPASFNFVKRQGGCGKTTIAKNIMAYTRSIGNIALGCASTGLAATFYDDFYTANALFCYPVVEQDDKDESADIYCIYILSDYLRNRSFQPIMSTLEQGLELAV
jgi:hypothetical protein